MADVVYFTAGGWHYHDTPECGALAGGQSGADSQKMRVHDIESGTVEVAKSRRLTPCGFCAPPR
jgi:hypothetical protein